MPDQISRIILVHKTGARANMISLYVNRRITTILLCSFLCFMLYIFIFSPFRSVLAAPYSEPAVRTTYYVSANSGSNSNSGRSESDAFRTLNYAMEKTEPGDTVLVMNGTYEEDDTRKATLRITENKGGTEGNWITYKAYPGHSPLIQSNGYWFAIDIRAPYIIIDGFEVRGIRSEVSYQEALDAYTDIRDNGGEGNKRVHGHGILTYSYNIIRNNIVHNFGSTGIELERSDQIIVENNTVYNTSNYAPNGTSGISVIYPRNNGDPNEGLEGTKYKIIIRGNTLYENENYFPCSCYDFREVTDGSGLIIDLANDYQGWTLVSNNLAFNNGGYGIHTYKTRNIDILNNTVYKNGQSDDIQGDIIISKSENVTVANNVIYAQQGYKISDSNDGTNITYSHNIYYDGTDSPDIRTPLGDGDIIANPRFRSPSFDPDDADFRLSSSSSAIDSAGDEFLPDTDIRGAPRYQGSGDRGAYENTNVPPTSTELGDVDCDGDVDSADALAILQYSVDIRGNGGNCPISNTSTQINALAGDVNDSGDTSATDALLVLQCAVGISNTFCSNVAQLDANAVQAAENSAIRVYLPYVE